MKTLTKAKVINNGDNTQTVKWGGVSGATEYKVRLVQKGKVEKTAADGTVSAVTFSKAWKESRMAASKRSYRSSNLTPGEVYVYRVVAVKKTAAGTKTLAKSKKLYAVNGSGNADSVKTSKNTVSLKKGWKVTIKASATTADGKKAYRGLRYYSTKPSVAAVTKKGVVKGKKKGTASVYAVAANGKSKKIRVTVE